MLLFLGLLFEQIQQQQQRSHLLLVHHKTAPAEKGRQQDKLEPPGVPKGPKVCRLAADRPFGDRHYCIYFRNKIPYRTLPYTT